MSGLTITIYTSDRNERPYKCTSCDATFTRKDVFKRHYSRYHGQSVEVVQEQSDVDPPISSQTRLTRTSSLGAASVTAQDGIEPPPASGRPPFFDPTDVSLMNSPTMNSLIPGLDFPEISASNLFSNLTGSAQENWHPEHPDLSPSYLASFLDSATSTVSTPQSTEPPAWKGSFFISERKRCQLASEAGVPAEVRFGSPC